MRKHFIIKGIALTVMVLMASGIVHGQSDPTPPQDCGEYQWPEVMSPCPEVQIKQKHDHTSQYRYRQNGWDTVVSCAERELVLSCMPYIPARRFSGTYYVDEIPFNPPDPSFYLNYNPTTDANNPYKKKLAISSDDAWAPSYINIAFPFYFFGRRKTQFLLGDNGIVTFATPPNYTGGAGCPFATTTPLPWPSSVPTSTSASGSLPSPALMRDAIYGVFEDTYTGSGGSYMSGNQGIYYGVIGEPPCRKIIASWNQIPVYSDQNKRQKYQIVCYEGSNIIEIHVATHNCCSSTNGGNGLLGIQNATGQPQVKTGTDLSTVNGAPAAFYPNAGGFAASLNYNNGMFHGALTNRAWRFTPATNNATNTPTYGWRRIFDDGRPDIELPNINTDPLAANDTNGYYEPMDDESTCKTLTKAYVKPRVPSKYVFYLNFMNANDDWYHLADTIFVGVDTADYLNIHKSVITDTLHKKLDICEGAVASMRIDMTTIQQISHEEWRLFRVAYGDTIALDSTQIQISPLQTIPIFRIVGNDTTALEPNLYPLSDYHRIGESIQVRNLTVNPALLPPAARNKIDTLIVRNQAFYVSGCNNFDTMMIRVFPNFDTIVRGEICRGESYTWDTNGHAYKTFREDTDPQTTFVTLHSEPGCDSTVRLLLKVYDVSYTIDPVEDCKPIVWRNGKTYSQNNTLTAATDTVVLHKVNSGCDSIVQLQFEIHPLTAKLHSDVESFTLDNLSATLTDISTGGNSRVWKLPWASDQTGSTAYYTIPADKEGANIVLIESSEFGCIDKDSIYIPLNKEHFWMPNAFTPDNPAGNNRFGSVSTKTLHEEMHIYNRRGELVFHCVGVDCSWDGRDMNGNPCVQGAYVYVIRYTNEYEPKNTRVIKGTVTLIR